MLPGLGLDENFARTDSSGTSAMLSDLFGSTLGLVNSSGALGTQYQYGPFGQTTMTGTSSTNPFQYTGREMDPTGLYNLRARYYNPIAQRFISQDPIGLSGGQPNLYAYVFNQPTNWTDPLGLSSSGVGQSPAPNAPPPQPCLTSKCENRIGGHGGGHSPHGLVVNILPRAEVANATDLSFELQDQDADAPVIQGPEGDVVEDLEFPADLAGDLAAGDFFPPYYAPSIAAPKAPGE
jgi:RHS repeat-associated protein